MNEVHFKRMTFKKTASKKKQSASLLIFLAAVMLGLAGCSKDATSQDTAPPPSAHQGEKPESTAEAESPTELPTTAPTAAPTAVPATAPQKISAQQAKEMMDGSSALILLDVRTQEEYDEGHIGGALLIPDYEIGDKAGEQLEDKDATILIYCRSGRRSALAAQALSDLGYSSVYDFGGIIDWPYEIIKE